MSDTNRLAKSLLESDFILPILEGICRGCRPAQMARQLRVTQQDVYYHTKRMRQLGIIEKEKDVFGRVSWRLTEKGDFILKELLRTSAGYGVPKERTPCIRHHNASYSFKILSETVNIPEEHWVAINNGVKKYFIGEKGKYTIELTKSDKQHSIMMTIHLPPKYFHDPDKALLLRYDDARDIARMYAERLDIEISERGTLAKKPHFAFENDLLARYIATYETVDVETRHGKAWIDSSNGSGEFETNDRRYSYLYLNLPIFVYEIRRIVEDILTEISTHGKCSASLPTENN